MKTWTTKDGQEIPIKELEDNHLRNILRMLRRNAVNDQITAKASYVYAPLPSGDAAQLCFETELENLIDSDWRDFVHKTFDQLEAEARRRGIGWEI